MGLEEIIGGGSEGPDEKRIPIHTFMALLHWRIEDPVRITNAKAKAALEYELERSLTSAEQTRLLEIIADIAVGKYTARDLEAAFFLKERGWATLIEVKALLGW